MSLKSRKLKIARHFIKRSEKKKINYIPIFIIYEIDVGTTFRSGLIFKHIDTKKYDRIFKK